MQDVRYKCTNEKCDFENYIAGYCPKCEIGYLRKVCECDSGKYETECCRPELEEEERKMREAMKPELSKEKEKIIEKSIKEDSKIGRDLYDGPPIDKEE